MPSKIGTNVDAWCSRCKLELAHTIEVVVEGKIKRVHCNTCGAQHAYRASAPGTRAPTGGRKVARRDQPTRRRDEYQQLLRGRSASAARAYSDSTRWKVGELVSHAVFGLGAVTGERDNKIDVLFPDGPRVLLQGGSGRRSGT